jgi:hypothetical protein
MGDANDRADRQFQQADLAIESTVARFVSAVDRMMGRWDNVGPTYIFDRVLVELCEELTKRMDKEPTAIRGPAALKLSNAMADYRDSPVTERWD